MSRFNYSQVICPSILTEYNKREKKLQRKAVSAADPVKISKPGARVINLYSKTGSRRAA